MVRIGKGLEQRHLVSEKYTLGQFSGRSVTSDRDERSMGNEKTCTGESTVAGEDRVNDMASARRYTTVDWGSSVCGKSDAL